MEELENVTIPAYTVMKWWLVNNINIKYFQLGQKVPDISVCPKQIILYLWNLFNQTYMGVHNFSENLPESSVMMSDFSKISRIFHQQSSPTLLFIKDILTLSFPRIVV